MANALSQLASGLDRPSGNPVGRWVQSVAQRTMNPLATLATEAKRWQDIPREQLMSEVAGNLTGGVGGILGTTAYHGSLQSFIEKARQTLPTKNENIIQKKANEWYKNSLLPKPEKIEQTDFDAYDAIKMVGQELYNKGHKVAGASDQSASVYYKNPETGLNFRLSDHPDIRNSSRAFDKPFGEYVFDKNKTYTQGEIDDIAKNILMSAPKTPYESLLSTAQKSVDDMMARNAKKAGQ